MNDTYQDCNRDSSGQHRKGFKATVAIVALLAAGAVATTAFSMGHRGGFGGPMARIADRLDLTEAQQQRIETILETSREEAEPLRKELEGMRLDLKALVQTDEFYEDQVRAEIGAHSNTMVELAVLGARTMHSVRSELTPEQRDEAQAMMDRFAEYGPRNRGWRNRNKAGD